MYEKNYQSTLVNKKSVSKTASRKKISIKSFFKIILFCLIIFGFIFLFRHPKFQVKEINSRGVEVISSEDINIFVMNNLLGKYLWFIPKTSIFLINEKKLEEKIKKNFSRIETIKIKRSNFYSLDINVKEFDAAFIWCSNTIDDCYFMDKNSVVYSKAPVFSGTAYVKIVTELTPGELPFSGLTSDQISQVLEIQSRLAAINIVPAVFYYVSEKRLNIDFLHNSSTSQIFMDPSADTETSLEYFFSGIRTAPLSSSFSNKNKKLLYIDVRFPSKILYKFDTDIESVE